MAVWLRQPVAALSLGSATVTAIVAVTAFMTALKKDKDKEAELQELHGRVAALTAQLAACRKASLPSVGIDTHVSWHWDGVWV